MSDSLCNIAARGGDITLPFSRLHLALAVSLVLHALALMGLPQMRLFEEPEGKKDGLLAVRLVPEEGAPPVPRPSIPIPPLLTRPQRNASPVPKEPAVPSKPAPPPPRTLTAERAPGPALAEPKPEPKPEAKPPALGDFSALVEARRRARGASEPPPQPPVETEQERDNRLAARNLGLDAQPTRGTEHLGGGLFQIWRMTRDEAEFGFHGYNKELRRNSMQMISVQRGSSPTIEQAIVKKMVLLIRETESGDFVFESPRLGRHVTLSARPADGAKLEEFLMLEFFSRGRPR